MAVMTGGDRVAGEAFASRSTVWGANGAAATAHSLASLIAIDLLRGLTICFMIMVNDNGSDAAYWFMKHAEWNGFTPTDLVFPTFLLLVGVSTVLSTAKRLEQGASKLSLWGHVVRRSVILFLLGLVIALMRLSSFPPVRGAAWFYIWFVRGTPIILQLVFLYDALPLVGIKLDSFTTAVVGFLLNEAAFSAEIIRGFRQNLQTAPMRA